MPDDATQDSVSLATWLERLHERLGADGGRPLTMEEQAALLDIARIAAHGSERTAAPLSTFLAGVAYGTLPPKERPAALRGLADQLEA